MSDVKDWMFRVVERPARTGPRENYEAGLAWTNPAKGGLMVAVLGRGTVPQLEVWGSREIGTSTVGLKHVTRPASAEDVVQHLQRLGPLLVRLFGDKVAHGLDGIICDPRTAVTPREAEAPKEEKPTEEAPKPPPETAAPPETALPPPEPPAVLGNPSTGGTMDLSATQPAPAPDEAKP